MVVTGVVQKNQLYQAICDAIVSPGSNWTQISSNTTEDYNYAGSDGKIYKSPPIGVNNQSVIFRMKQQLNEWGTQTGSLRLGMYINIMKNYTPGAAGTNGVMTDQSYANLAVNIYPFNIIEQTELFRYYILIENHRIMIMYWKETFDTGKPYTKSVFYIGYPELTTNFEIPGVTNNISIICTGYYGNGASYNYINVILENGTATKIKMSNGGQMDCWAVNSYDTSTNTYTLYPIPIEKNGVIPGIIFQGYLDGAYLLYGVNAAHIQDLDIISDGVNNYLVLGTTLGLYYSGGYYAIRLT